MQKQTVTSSHLHTHTREHTFVVHIRAHEHTASSDQWFSESVVSALN